MQTEAKQVHIIFQSQNGANGTWLDYCREEPGFEKDRAEVWANEECKHLTKRIGCATRYRIEVW